MTEANALARVAAWLEPISGATPAGDDARYDPLHEQIRAEAAKLDAPAGGLPNWTKLVSDAEQLTSTKSKDLLIESYAAYALYQTEGLQGLASGLFLLAESMDRYWEVMHPTAKRLRARVNAINWLTERVDVTLPNTQVTARDTDAVAALEASVKRLRGVVAEKFVEEAPSLRPLSDAVERMKLSLPVAAPSAPAAPSPPAPSPPAPMVMAEPAFVAPAATASPVESASAADPGPDLAAELSRMAEPYVQPIPGPAPAGGDAKYEPSHEEVRSAVAALDSPSAGAVDWAQVVPKAELILRDKSKDLLIATYLTYGLYQLRELEGLALGFEIITQLCERYWEDSFPTVKRLRGRGNAVAWLLDRLELTLPNTKVTAKQKRDLELLDIATRRLTGVIRDKFDDAAPPTRPLIETVARLKISLPVAAAPKPPAPPMPAAQASPAPIEPAVAAAPAPPAAPNAAVDLPAPSTVLADPKEVGSFATAVGKSLVDAAALLRAAAPADPAPYQFVRIGQLLGTQLPVADGSTTRVPAPAAGVVNDIEQQLRKAQWDVLLARSETNFVAKRYWLDLHRYSALALRNLGYAAAADAVLACTALWVRTFPRLLELTFAGGMPFANESTKQWIASEVLPSGGEGSDTGEGADVVKDALSLAGGGKVDDAVRLLDGVAKSSASGRMRFRARLAMAQTLSTAATVGVAEGLYDALIAEIDVVGLESWEPDLAVECYRGLLSCLKQLKKSNDPVVSQQTALVYRRLCRVDPLAALKAV